MRTYKPNTKPCAKPRPVQLPPKAYEKEAEYTTIKLSSYASVLKRPAAPTAPTAPKPSVPVSIEETLQSLDVLMNTNVCWGDVLCCPEVAKADAMKAAEEAKRVEEARKAAEEAKRVEEARKAAEEAKRAEEARKVAEEARKAAEAAKRAEEARKAAEAAKRAEEARKTAEAAKKAEEARKADEEAKRVEEARKVAEAAKKAEEAKRAEEARKAAEEAKRAEEARKAAEEAKRAEEAKEAKKTYAEILQINRYDLEDKLIDICINKINIQRNIKGVNFNVEDVIDILMETVGSKQINMEYINSHVSYYIQSNGILTLNQIMSECKAPRLTELRHENSKKKPKSPKIPTEVELAKMQRDRFASESTRIPYKKIKYNASLFKQFYNKAFDKWCSLDHYYNYKCFTEYFYHDNDYYKWAVFSNGSNYGCYSIQEIPIKVSEVQKAQSFPFPVHLFLVRGSVESLTYDDYLFIVGKDAYDIMKKEYDNTFKNNDRMKLLSVNTEPCEELEEPKETDDVEYSEASEASEPKETEEVVECEESEAKEIEEVEPQDAEEIYRTLQELQKRLTELENRSWWDLLCDLTSRMCPLRQRKPKAHVV